MKRKLLVIGYARCGKDTAAEVIAQVAELKFISSSMFAADKIFGSLNEIRISNKQQPYKDVNEAFEDRINYRSLWRDLINEYNTPLHRLSLEIMSENDMYVGLRDEAEFEAAMSLNIFDLVIWIDASERISPEPKNSCTVRKDMADIVITNNGTEEEFIKKVTAFARTIKN